MGFEFTGGILDQHIHLVGSGWVISLLQYERQSECILRSEGNWARQWLSGAETVRCQIRVRYGGDDSLYLAEVPSASPLRRRVALPAENVQSEDAATASAQEAATNNVRRDILCGSSSEVVGALRLTVEKETWLCLSFLVYKFTRPMKSPVWSLVACSRAARRGATSSESKE